MLDPKKYNLKALKAMPKKHFFQAYQGKMFNIDAVWEWLHPAKKKGGVKSNKEPLD